MTSLYFYQSTNPVRTLIDFDNPQHVQLHDMIRAGQTPSPAANRLMRAIGLAPQYEGRRILWSSDLWLMGPAPSSKYDA